MPNPFENVTFAKYTPTYVGAPLEQFAKTSEALDTRYWENRDSVDQLQQAMMNIPVDEQNKPILKSKMEAINNQLKSVVDNDDYINGTSTIKNAFKSLVTDNAVKAATEHYAEREKIKEELRTRYDKGALSISQYNNAIKRFNAYAGIGSPDDLGFYNKYEFAMGPNKVDLDEFANKKLSGYSPDVATSQSSGVTYGSAEERQLGLANRQVTSSTQVSNGIKAKFILQDAMHDDPDALAYIQDEVRIHNEENPDNPITVDSYIENYANDYIRKFNKVVTSTSSNELREKDEYLQMMQQNLMKNNSKSSGGKKDENGDDIFIGTESIPSENTPYAEDEIIKYIKRKNGNASSLWSWLNGLSEEKQKVYENLRQTLGSDDNVRLYLENIKTSGISNTYNSFSTAFANKQKGILERNLVGRKLYNLKTNEVVSADILNKQEGEDKPNWEVSGLASTNNVYVDFTNDASFARPIIITVNNEPYAISMSKSEQEYAGKTLLTLNQLTKSYRSGVLQPVIDPETGKVYKSKYLKNTREIEIFDTNNKSIGKMPYTGMDAQDMENFNAVIDSK